MILENRDGKLVAIDADGNETQVRFGTSIIEDQLGIPVYSDDGNAPSETQYFNDTDSAIKYKDADGNVHSTSGGDAGGGIENPLQSDLDANGHAITNAGSLSTETLVNDQHYAGAFDGSDPSTRLSNAFDKADSGDTIYLENATYTGDISIVGTYRLVGSGRSGASFEGSLTLTSNSVVENVELNNGGSINASGVAGRLKSIYDLGDGITVSNDNVLITDSFGLSVTFESGTSGGLVDSCTNTTVTDNGSNTVGDIT